MKRTVKRTLLACLPLTGVAFGQGTGQLALEPVHGTVGSAVTATLTGLEPGRHIELVWTSADARWNVGEGTFHGVVATDTRAVLGTARVDGEGAATLTFAVPEDYGYVHNLFVEADGEQLARQGVTLVPQLTIAPTAGPVRIPITLTMTGIGYRFWESVWHLLYDGAHSGWVSAITSRGTAVITLPATGEVGVHSLQALSGRHPVPYLNQQQSPNYKPAVPTVLGALFEVSEASPVAAADPATQTLPRWEAVRSPAGDGPTLRADHGSGPVGSPLALEGSGFPPEASVALRRSTVTGNRISGAGWEEVERVLRELTTDTAGAFTLTLATPDDLGGAHTLSAAAAEAVASLPYTITPSVASLVPAVVAPGGDLTLTLKGVGRTETANIYPLLLDNGHLGYGCGFNSQGDVTIHLKAPGREGMHYLGLHPSIYQGEVTSPGGPTTPDANATYLQLPMLHYQDHPGEALPAFLSFGVRAG